MALPILYNFHLSIDNTDSNPVKSTMELICLNFDGDCMSINIVTILILLHVDVLRHYFVIYLLIFPTSLYSN